MIQTSMNITISHDWLLNRPGAEKILREFSLGNPKLDIYTLFLRPEILEPSLALQSIYMSPLGRLPQVERYYRYLLPVFFAGMNLLHAPEADLLLSIHHSVAKTLPHHPGTHHVCYCLTPMRYVWEPELYSHDLRESWRARLLNYLEPKLKAQDLQSNAGVNSFVAISRTVQHRIRKFYDRDSEVIYPGIDLDFYHPTGLCREDFYLVVSALVPQKRIELAVQAFSQNGRRLLVVGEGPLRRSLERMAGDNVHFLGWVSNETLHNLYCRARALVFPGLEDFGLVPVEAQACGCPVIAYRAGGATETVLDGETGIFFDHPNGEAVLDALQRFESLRLDAVLVRRNANRFSIARFRDNWSDFLRKTGFPGAFWSPQEF